MILERYEEGEEKEVVMVAYAVTSDQYREIARHLIEIKRQLDQEGGCPHDPQKIIDALQRIAEGDFSGVPQVERRLIDCDAVPFIPSDWSVVEHKRSGQLVFDAGKIKFHLDPAQRARRVVGYDLRQKLVTEPVLNANVLDHLLANTNLIPEDWKSDEQGRTRFIFFWGTIYRDSDDNLCVRHLYWSDGQWRWGHRWLDNLFVSQNPAAISAN